MAAPENKKHPLVRRIAQRDQKHSPQRQGRGPEEESPQDMSYHLTENTILDIFKTAAAKEVFRLELFLQYTDRWQHY